nr:reverse transcriptase domain-containing protein [Tanacetum cinerariifolium]
MPNYEKFIKELVSNKHKLEQILSAFLSDESSAMIQNKVPPKLGDPESFLIPCNFSKAFSCNALADLGASINLMPYSLYAKLSLKTLKPTKIIETILKEKIFAEFNESMAMIIDENFESDSDTEEPPFEKITFNTDYKIKTSLEEPPSDLENLFLITWSTVLGHKVFSAGLEVDKAMIDVISKLSPPTNIKGIRSFLGHAGFYRRFNKDFSKITHPLTKLLEKDTPFKFNEECHKASLKEKLTCTPVIVSPNWNLPFELLCDASNFAVGAVLD